MNPKTEIRYELNLKTIEILQDNIIEIVRDYPKMKVEPSIHETRIIATKRLEHFYSNSEYI